MKKYGYMSFWVGKIESKENLFNYVDIKYIQGNEKKLPEFSKDYDMEVYKKKLIQYIDEYTSGNELKFSKFLKDYNISSYEYDEDFVETIYKKDCISSVSELLKGCSYEEVVIPNCEKLLQSIDNCNAAILLYDYQYDGNVKEISNDEYKFKYVGAVPYK